MIDPGSTIHVLTIEGDIDPVGCIGAWLDASEPLQFQVTPAGLSDVARDIEFDGYDCMLLDLGIPDSRGMETLVSAREMAIGLPIVVLAAADDYEVAERSMRSGADDYLVKGSFGPEILIETIVAAVDSRRDQIAPFDHQGRSLNPQYFEIPMSARIAGELPSGLGSSNQMLDRYRRASGLRF